MARYIDAEKLLNKMKQDPLFPLVDRYGVSGVIEAEPTANVRENVHGRWKGEGFGDRSCSICGSVFTVDTCMGKTMWNYCPNCGADMRERRDDAENVAEDYADCDQFVCSNCGIELQEWLRVERDEDDGDITYSEYVFKFCPNCGAKMRKRRDDG